MTHDLNDLLGAAVTARTATLTGTSLDGVVERARRRVRGRRARRHAYEASGALAVVAAIGAGAWWGVQRDDPLPAVEPTTSSSPSASATPTGSPDPVPTPTPTPGATPAAGAGAITDDAVRASAPGWVLTTWWAEGAGWSLALTGPDGTTRRTPIGANNLTVTWWQGGDERALAHLEREGGFEAVWVDLRDGSLTPVGVPDDAQWLGATPAGTTLWQRADGSLVALDDGGVPTVVGPPGRMYNAYLSPSATRAWNGVGVSPIPPDGEVRAFLPPPGTSLRWCDLAGWLSDDTVVLQCTDDASATSTWAWDWAAGTTTRVYEELSFSYPLVAGVLADGRQVVTDDTEGMSATWLVGAGEPERLLPDHAYVTALHVLDDGVVLEVREDDWLTAAVVRYDARTGRTVDLVSSEDVAGAGAAALVSVVVGE